MDWNVFWKHVRDFCGALAVASSALAAHQELGPVAVVASQVAMWSGLLAGAGLIGKNRTE